MINSDYQVEMLRRLQVRAASQMVLPGGQFFTPLEIFWATLEAQTHRGQPIKWVDCGAGTGHVSAEAERRSIPMLAIDISGREDQMAHVMRMDAVEFKWSPSVCPLICRPDHSGWALDAIEAAINKGAIGYYVGLQENVGRDLDNDDGLAYELVTQEPVGQDGELIYKVFRC